ncbi:MAG: hypothetical protein K9I68_03120 [Bacteroidales bacterium]|nr:hypothetical protein [Bacteroidales bacterium]MCF8336848.1 hypothetical protein [Bacteroidales bacterium]
MRYWLTSAFIFLLVTAFSQEPPSTGFLRHLMDREYYKEVVYLLEQTDYDDASLARKDSINYIKGWSLYSMKALQRSAGVLKSVSRESPYYLPAHFFAAYNHAHLGQYGTAGQTLDSLRLENSNMASLRAFENAGIALLQRDYKAFEDRFNQADTSYYPIKKASDKMLDFARDLESHRKKSPVVAGAMSAIVPGAGKIYAGQTGEGISAFLTAGGLGFVTWENYHKNGWKDVKTLLFGAVFAAFYGGNIYGTVVSVEITENEFQKAYDNKILFNLHIPLRNVFN